MNRADAISLLQQYASVTKDPKICALALYVDRDDEVKTMYGLGLVVGRLLESGRYTVGDIEVHMRTKRVPTLAEELTRDGAAPCPDCCDNTVVAFDCANKQMGWYQICLNENCDYVRFQTEHGSEDA